MATCELSPQTAEITTTIKKKKKASLHIQILFLIRTNSG